jgi:hypothetical protein
MSPIAEGDCPEELPTYGVQDYVYDPDFSEASTPPSSDPDDLSDGEPLDPEVAALVLPCFSQAPDLPGVDFKWDCPVKGCTYMIDLLHLSKKNMEGVSEDIVKRLKSKDWSMFDRGPETTFQDMVDHHYRDHFRQLGIKWEGNARTVSGPTMLYGID